jgi:hypothetical protein
MIRRKMNGKNCKEDAIAVFKGMDEGQDKEEEDKIVTVATIIIIHCGGGGLINDAGSGNGGDNNHDVHKHDHDN